MSQLNFSVPNFTNMSDYAPAYIRIANSLRESIERSQWGSGGMLPSEPQLANIFNVSIGTVKKSIQLLVSEGFLYRIQGKGTFTSGSFIRSDKLKFYRNQPAFHATDPDTAAKFIECKAIPQHAEASRALQIPQDSELIFLSRLIQCNNEALVVVHSFFEKKRFSNLLNETPQRFEQEALTRIIENNYSTPTKKTNELFSSIIINDKSISSLLRINDNSHILLIEMISYTYKENPYEYRRSYCLPGKKFFREY